LLAWLALLAACGGERAAETPQPATLTAKPPAALPPRVVAVGDLHGDIDATRAVLRLAGLIGDDDRWSGGDAVLVQTGDRLDRGDDERAVLDLLLALRDQARAAGGQVILLNGNHEFINLGGDFRYVPESACAGFADMEGLDTGRAACAGMSGPCARRCAALLPGGPYGRLLAELPIAAAVGESVFVHAALYPEHARLGLERLNAEARAFARGERAEPPPFLGRGASGTTWSRDLSEGEVDPAKCGELAETLSILGARRLVVGHTVQPRINPACDGLVWRIDTGMSAHYGGPIQALELAGDRVRVLVGVPAPAPASGFPSTDRPVL
jgi:hypothetical protein